MFVVNPLTFVTKNPDFYVAATSFLATLLHFCSFDHESLLIKQIQSTFWVSLIPID